MTLAEANALAFARFVAQFGGVFEHSPWVAERVALKRPFPSVAALHAAMCAEVARAGVPAQMQLLRAHPELAALPSAALSAHSAREQAGAGLADATAAEAAELQRLNAQYRERFGFPFIVAVRGLDRAQVLAQLHARVHAERADEFAEALRQVERIARLRLEAMIVPDPAR